MDNGAASRADNNPWSHSIAAKPYNINNNKSTYHPKTPVTRLHIISEADFIPETYTIMSGARSELSDLAA